jgi:predicted ATPase
MAQAETGPVFFDRGVPDMVGYFHLLERPVPSHVTRAAERFRYSRRVFLAPPWPAIFRQDAERKQMVVAYSNCGYELVALPLASVEERARFVLDTIGA